MSLWNPWHGCTKISPGCEHCYVYRRDAEFGKDASVVTKTASFGLPLKRDRKGGYKLKPDGDFVYTCFTSDFFHPAADEWRVEAWQIMRERQDLNFMFITKRIERFKISLPDDWGDGYENVHIGCTCESQKMADKRLSLFLELPIRHRIIVHEPMLEAVWIEPFLERYKGAVDSVICGGESGPEARLCDFGWIIKTMEQCMKHDVPFHFKQTGANFRKGGRLYRIERKDQMVQAAKARVDYRY